MSDKFQGGVKADSTSVSVDFLLRKTSDNTEQTGKVASDLTVSYQRQGGVRVAVSPSDLAAVNSAYSSGGVKEIDSANMPGLYRLDVPDAAFANGADWVIVSVKVASCYVWFEKFNITTNVIQTGDSFARVGAAGAGLTALGDSRIALIDAAVSSRMATFTLPANFSALLIDGSGRVTLVPGQIAIKKNTALNNFQFLMTDSTTHAPKTGLTVTATRNIDNAGFGSCANAVSEVGNGVYVISLAAADLNGNVIAFRMTGTGADDLNFTVITQA